MWLKREQQGYSFFGKGAKISCALTGSLVRNQARRPYKQKFKKIK
jgi:hypothetical protein